MLYYQGFTGKPGMEGPQGPVGMYVSDSSAGEKPVLHVHSIHLQYMTCVQCTIFCGLKKPRLTSRVTGREEHGEGQEQLMVQSHHIIYRQ